MSSKTFKKLSVVKLTSNFGEATKLVQVPLTPPGDNQVLLKNIYAGVNATDINITAGRYFTDGKLPFDIGFEAVGIVESVGKNVNTIKPGTPGLVMCQGSSKGFSEYLYLDPKEVVPIPEAKPEYISLLVCGLTATIGLDFAGKIKANEKVFITAAAGGTGHICVQWAKMKGCHVIGTCSSKEKAELLKKLGCDRVINYKEESIDEVLTKEYPEGLDVIWETIGGSVFQMLFKHIGVKGRMVVIGGITGYKESGFPDTQIPNLSTSLVMGSRSLVGFLLMDYIPEFQNYLPKLIELVSSNKLQILVDLGKSCPEGAFEGVESVVRGEEWLHKGANSGKVVIKIS